MGAMTNPPRSPPNLNDFLPSDVDLAEAPVLNDWSFYGISLMGTVFGHPTIPTGHWCYTSVVLAISADRTWARTMNRFYWLGRLMTDS
jgi:hypothetical protein